MRILVTRPEPGASATAARLAAMGHEAVLAPCLTISALPERLPARAGAVIITSGQAVPALPRRFADLKLFCVGDATAARLRAAGFRNVESASGDAEDLYRLILARRVAGTHVMVVGRGHGMKLAQDLRAAGFAVVRRAVYAARPVRALPETGELDAALFYSAESARAFVRLRPEGMEGVVAGALSAAVAEPLRGLPWRAIRVAVTPTEMDLMAVLDE
jgi:uroporphyrinogen-III synthase